MEAKNCSAAKICMMVGLILVVVGVVLFATSLGYSPKGKTQTLAISKSNIAGAQMVAGSVFMSIGALISCLSILKSNKE